MAKIAVVAPVYITNDMHFSLADITMKTLSSSENKLDRIAVVNSIRNNDTDEAWVKSNFDYIEQNDQNILSRAWNKGITKAFERGNDYAMVINLDLVFRLDTVDNLNLLAQKNPDPIIWSSYMFEGEVAGLPKAILSDELINDVHFSLFLVNNRFLNAVGPFDEGFKPVYHEDSDMRWRIGLKGLSMLSWKRSQFFHVENGTLKSSERAKTQDEKILVTSLSYTLKRYIAKWGGYPGKEVFKLPFNGASEKEAIAAVEKIMAEHGVEAFR